MSLLFCGQEMCLGQDLDLPQFSERREDAKKDRPIDRLSVIFLACRAISSELP